MESGAAEPVVGDALGRPCPIPVIELARAVAAVKVGREVVVLSDDVGAKVDIPVWCRMRNQELVDVSESDGRWTFRVRRLR